MATETTNTVSDIDQRARELADDFFTRAPQYRTKETLIGIIASAIRAERRKATEDATKEESGWLIELKNSVQPVPTWYGRCHSEEGILGWTTEHTDALRFARKVDAEMVIEDLGLTEAFACEHGWGP